MLPVAHHMAAHDMLHVVGLSYGWGNASSGRLGLGSAAATFAPQRVPFKLSIIQVACGEAHSMALTLGGFVHAWGDNRCADL